MQEYLSKALRHLHESGFFSTLRTGLHVIYRDFHEWWFDYKWRTNTRLNTSDLQGNFTRPPLTPLQHGPTTPAAFQEIMRAIRHIPIPATFFDMGCGKGRVLIMAAEHEFNHIVGVELDPLLAGIAEKNIGAFRAQPAQRTKIEVVCEDAGTYGFPDENAVIFFHNPYDATIMDKTLKNIRRSAHRNKERYIIYHNAVFESLLSNPMEFAFLVRGDDYCVYRMIF